MEPGINMEQISGDRASTPSRSPDLSVVLPTINEKDNLELLLPTLKEITKQLGIVAEILIVDGGSVDGTPDTARRFGARVVQQTERGYGGALLAGFANARGSFVLTMDADLSHRPVVVEKLWAARDQAELLIASRYIEGGRSDVTGYRSALSRILNVTYRRVLSVPTRDLSSGFRLYRQSVLASIRLDSTDFDVLEEILIRFQNDGWRIGEVPFLYMARGSGESHVRLFKFAWAYAKTLIRMWRLRNSLESADYDYRAFDSPIFFQHYWQRRRHDAIARLAQGSARVLYVGCGSSRLPMSIPNCTGLDMRHNKLRFLRSFHSGLVEASPGKLPFADGAFDCIICSNVMKDGPHELFIECARVLRPGGKLIVVTPDYSRRLWWFFEWLHRTILRDYFAEHIERFTRRDLEKQLLHMGLEVVACEYIAACEMIMTARTSAAGLRAMHATTEGGSGLSGARKAFE